LRVGLAAALTTAAAAHLPVLADHLREAPWLGWLFVAFIAASLALGVVVLTGQLDWPLPAAAALSGSAIGVYAASRLFPFPQVGDDVGDWFDPWGMAAVAAEAAALLVALNLVRARTALVSETE
jgi:hypothetical protein